MNRIDPVGITKRELEIACYRRLGIILDVLGIDEMNYKETSIPEQFVTYGNVTVVYRCCVSNIHVHNFVRQQMQDILRRQVDEILTEDTPTEIDSNQLQSLSKMVADDTNKTLARLAIVIRIQATSCVTLEES